MKFNFTHAPRRIGYYIGDDLPRKGYNNKIEYWPHVVNNKLKPVGCMCQLHALCTVHMHMILLYMYSRVCKLCLRCQLQIEAVSSIATVLRVEFFTSFAKGYIYIYICDLNNCLLVISY